MFMKVFSVVVGDAPKQDLGQNTAEVALESRLKEKRMLNVTQNDFENLPFGLIAMFSSLLFAKDPNVHIAAAISFTVARVLHTLVYMYGKQPWRAIFYWVAMIGMWTMIGNSIAGVFWRKGNGILDGLGEARLDAP